MAQSFVAMIIPLGSGLYPDNTLPGPQPPWPQPPRPDHGLPPFATHLPVVPPGGAWPQPPQPPQPPGIWGPTDPRPTNPIAGIPGFPGYNPPGRPPGIWGPTDPRPTHPIAGIPGFPGYNPPYPDQGLPGPQPHPEHPIYIPPEGGPPPLGIWGPPDMPPGFWGGGMGPGVKPQPHPEHPIVLPPDLPPTTPEGGKITWKTAWTEKTGWVVIGIPSEGTLVPTPS